MRPPLKMLITKNIWLNQNTGWNVEKLEADAFMLSEGTMCDFTHSYRPGGCDVGYNYKTGIAGVNPEFYESDITRLNDLCAIEIIE